MARTWRPATRPAISLPQCWWSSSTVTASFRSQRPNATSSATSHDNARRQTPNFSAIRCDSNAPFLQPFVAEAADLPQAKCHCRPPESVGKQRVTQLSTNAMSLRLLSQSVAPNEKCSQISPLWGGVGGGGRGMEQGCAPWHDPQPQPSPTRGEGVPAAQHSVKLAPMGATLMVAPSPHPATGRPQGSPLQRAMLEVAACAAPPTL